MWSAHLNVVLEIISHGFGSAIDYLRLHSTPPSPALSEEIVMWSSLPTDLLEAISLRLNSWVDNVRFRSVCNSWRSAAPKRPYLPFLLGRSLYWIRTGDLVDRSLKLYNLPNMEFYNQPYLSDEILKHNFICGSSRGWIGLKGWTGLEGVQCPSFMLHNPITGVTISLPNLFHPRKFVVSCDPAVEPDNCIVVMETKYPYSLVFCRLRDDSWTPICSRPIDISSVEDIIYYEGKFHVVCIDNRVFVCNLDPHNSSLVEISPANPLFYGGPSQKWQRPNPDIEDDYSFFDLRGDDLVSETNKFLVVSSAELLLVVIKSNMFRKTDSCEVFRVDVNGGQLRLFKLENLDGRALFLDLQSMSISLSIDDSSPTWCKGNCVYYVGIEYQIVVFNMEERTISYMLGLLDDLVQIHWLTPTLC